MIGGSGVLWRCCDAAYGLDVFSIEMFVLYAVFSIQLLICINSQSLVLSPRLISLSIIPVATPDVSAPPASSKALVHTHSCCFKARRELRPLLKRVMGLMGYESVGASSLGQCIAAERSCLGKEAKRLSAWGQGLRQGKE